ncbi:MAG: cell division protein FtsQ/DivIB [Gammaproteobacteria bacterium]
MRAEAIALSPQRWSQRGRGWLLIAALATAVVVFARFFFVVPAGPPVTQIAVSVSDGAPLSPAAVRAAALPVLQDGLFTVNLDAVRARVEALPWVAHARVRRQWPGTLAIDVTLEQPVAHWNAAALLGASGQVFSPPQAPRFANLPRLSGPPGSAAELFADFSRARALVAPRHLVIRAMRENARGELGVVFAGGLVLELGRDRPLVQLHRFVAVAVPALGPALARAATIDMRYPNGFAVAWRDNTDEGNHGQKN